MSPASISTLTDSVQAQARLRARFGLPVIVLMLALTYMDPAATRPQGLPPAVLAVLAYFVYVGVVRWLAMRPALLPSRSLVVATAVLDPLFLSAYLALSGESAMLLVGFYLYTTLGFGFRIGTRAMYLCQAMSLIGFIVAATMSPRWAVHPFAVASHVVLLLIVPLYAAGLINRLHTAKALAERESRAKSQLLANVSHELRTPLTGIVSSAQLIEVESTDAGSTGRAQSILELAQLLDSEITRLLDLARIESGRDEAPAIAFDLSLAAQHVMRALEPVASVKKLVLELWIDPGIDLPVLGRPQELTSVLMNLVGNAVKFTPEGGHVGISIELLDARQDSYRVRFSVSDTGIGIPEDMQERIFEPFMQVESGPVRRFGGTGLGTAIAKEHVERMGGRLLLESTLGRGSRFWFEVSLPTIDRRVGQEPAAQRAGMTVPVQRILVADDNHLNLLLMKDMFEKDGHAVQAVDSGIGALEALATGDFDAVFLDFNMHDVDGLTVLQTYRMGRIDPAPTWFVTADSTLETATRLTDAGAIGVIHKPVTFDKLRNALGFATGAPGSGGAPPQEALPDLQAVPTAYFDDRVLDHLREVKDSPEFLHAILGDGIADIATIATALSDAMRAHDLHKVHLQAHSMRGVALNVGAVRLAWLAERLMTIGAPALDRDLGRWLDDVEQATRRSIEALDQVRGRFEDAPDGVPRG